MIRKLKKALFFIFPIFVALSIFLMSAGIGSRQTFQASIQAAASQYDEPEQDVVVPLPVAQETIAPQPEESAIRRTTGIKAALAMEMESGHILFEQLKNQQVPIASLTKLMAAAIAMDSYNMAQKTTVSARAMAVEGEQGQLRLGEEMTVSGLLRIMLIESSNRAAQALSEIMGHNDFVERMNHKAAAIGLSQTHFTGVTGLNPSTQSTAYDVAKLSSYMFENYPLFREIIALPEYSLYMDGQFHHTLINTNKLLGQYGIVGGKTGWTDEAQGCMMAIQKNGGRHIIYVVLGMEDRFLEVKKLIEQIQ